MICDVCGRGARGFAYSPVAYPNTKGRVYTGSGGMACSLKCLEVIVQKHWDGKDFLPDENAAIEKGGKAAGAYLEQIGKTDLAAMTRDEWLDFLRTFEAARSEALRLTIPF